MTAESPSMNPISRQVNEALTVVGVDPSLGDEADLLEHLDSLLLLQLAISLEKRFSIKIANEELTRANVGTKAGLHALIARKVDGASAPARPLVSEASPGLAGSSP